MAIQVERTSPTTLTVTRRFAAAPARVFAAHTDPALLRQWLFGPDGWTMPVCEGDPRPGGAIRYRWENPADPAQGFGLTGTYESVEPPAGDRPGRIVHVERMHLGPNGPDPTPDSHVETTFAPDGDGTVMTLTMRVDSAETMDAMVATGMTDGMETSYTRLDALEPAAA